jgi:hypothetical protein
VEADLVSARASGTEADRMQNRLGIFGHESKSLSIEIVLCSANRYRIIAWLQQDVTKTFAGKVGAQHDELAMVETLDAGVGKDSAFQIFPSRLSVRIPVWPDLLSVLLFGDCAQSLNSNLEVGDKARIKLHKSKKFCYVADQRGGWPRLE